MPITSLNFTHVGPFEEIHFEFDHQVNVFVGPNNTGKSSVLYVLGDILVYPFDFPTKLLRHGEDAKFDIQFCEGFEELLPDSLPLGLEQSNWTAERTRNYVKLLKTIGFSTFIPALRWSTDFRSPGPRTTQPNGPQGRFRSYADDNGFPATRGTVQQRRTVRNPRSTVEESFPELERRLALISNDAALVSDKGIMQKFIELEYRSFLREQSRFKDILVKIGEIASDITEDFPLKFVGSDEDENGFFPKFATRDGFMPLNTLSQGTQSIIQWLAHFLIGHAEYYGFPENVEEKPGTLIIDEIDAHLHPSWQRRVIPTLTRHFPNLQIFCSTHSPLMLAGLKEGQVHLLQRDEQGRVTASRNEVSIGGWTADEILRHFLSVEDPTDLDAAGRLQRLQQLQRLETPTPEEDQELQSLQHSVSRDLMSGPISEQLEHFVEILKEARTESASASDPHYH